jgi:hypothetical protein
MTFLGDDYSPAIRETLRKQALMSGHTDEKEIELFAITGNNEAHKAQQAPRK